MLRSPLYRLYTPPPDCTVPDFPDYDVHVQHDIEFPHYHGAFENSWDAVQAALENQVSRYERYDPETYTPAPIRPELHYYYRLRVAYNIENKGRRLSPNEDIFFNRRDWFNTDDGIIGHLRNRNLLLGDRTKESVPGYDIVLMEPPAARYIMLGLRCIIGRMAVY